MRSVGQSSFRHEGRAHSRVQVLKCIHSRSKSHKSVPDIAEIGSGVGGIGRSLANLVRLGHVWLDFGQSWTDIGRMRGDAEEHRPTLSGGRIWTICRFAGSDLGRRSWSQSATLVDQLKGVGRARLLESSTGLSGLGPVL